MKGPFMVKLLDYFGLEHEFHVWAQTSDEAVKCAILEFGYPVNKVIYADLDYQGLIHQTCVTILGR